MEAWIVTRLMVVIVSSTILAMALSGCAVTQLMVVVISSSDVLSVSAITVLAPLFLFMAMLQALFFRTTGVMNPLFPQAGLLLSDMVVVVV